MLFVSLLTQRNVEVLILRCDTPVVLDTIRWYKIVETKSNGC